MVQFGLLKAGHPRNRKSDNIMQSDTFKINAATWTVRSLSRLRVSQYPKVVLPLGYYVIVLT